MVCLRISGHNSKTLGNFCTVGPRIRVRGLISQKVSWGGCFVKGGGLLTAARNITRIDFLLLLRLGYTVPGNIEARVR